MGAALVLLAEIGCAARNSAPEITSVTYDGPPLVLDRDGRTAMVVMTAPTPGWRVGVDRVDEGFGQRDIFMTVRPPNPKFAYAQVTVDQRVATNVGGDVRARLFVRMMPADVANEAPKAYSRVLVSEADRKDHANLPEQK